MFLVNSRQGYFRCGPLARAGLIPKVRPIFCRVPWSTLTRSPCSTRAAHLCRFAVRTSQWCSVEVFLGRLFTDLSFGRSLGMLQTFDVDVPRIFLEYASARTGANSIRRVNLFPPSLHHPLRGHGILTVCPSGAAFAIPLGPTNPGMITIVQETLVF